MAKQNIDVGSAANDRQGDSIRAAFQKVNANFTELYTALGLDDASLNIGAFEFSGSTITTTDSSKIIIGQEVQITSGLTVDSGIEGYLSTAQIKNIIADSSDFNDFKSKIAGL